MKELSFVKYPWWPAQNTPLAIRTSINRAEACGAKLFWLSCWEQYLPVIGDYLDEAVNHFGFKIGIYLEHRDSTPDRRMDFLHEILDLHGNHPALYRINGKPAVVIYDAGSGSIDDWARLLPTIPAFYIAEMVSTRADFLQLFDGLANYNVIHAISDQETDTDFTALEQYYKTRVAACKVAGKFCMVTAVPEFNEVYHKIPNRPDQRVLAPLNGKLLWRTAWAAIISGAEHLCITSMDEGWELSDMEERLHYRRMVRALYGLWLTLNQPVTQSYFIPLPVKP